MSSLIDYNTYNFKFYEWLFYVLLAAAFLMLVGYIFYNDLSFSLVISFFSVFYPSIRRKQIIKKRKKELNFQFRDALYYLYSSIAAGHSVEHAFSETLKALHGIYTDTNTPIIHEMEIIRRKLQLNETIESALEDFALRSHIEDIKNFSDVFSICKRSGGNLVEVIKSTSNIIREKIEIQQEINIMVSSKKLEQKILTVMPLGLIFFISQTGGDFIKPVFETFSGRIVMSIALLFIISGYFISAKITNISL